MATDVFSEPDERVPVAGEGEASGEVLTAGEADDKVLPTGDGVSMPGEAGDEVLPAGDEALPAREADDEVLWASDVVFQACDEVLPTGEVDDGVLVPGDSCDEFMAAPETFFGVTGRIRFRSMLSTCLRYSGLPRFFPTFMTSPGMTSWCVRYSL